MKILRIALLAVVSVLVVDNVRLRWILRDEHAERSKLVHSLGAAYTKLRRSDADRHAIQVRVDTQRIATVRFVNAYDTNAAWRKNIVQINGESRMAIPLPEVAMIDAGVRSCKQLTELDTLERSSCTRALAARDTVIASLTATVLSLTPPSPTRAAWTYGGAVTAGVVANRFLHVDTDHGGYTDLWSTRDKLAHAAVGFALSTTAMEMGVRPRIAVLLTCLGATGFEFSQGYVSRKDIVMGCGGAVAAPIVRKVGLYLVGR